MGEGQDIRLRDVKVNENAANSINGASTNKAAGYEEFENEAEMGFCCRVQNTCTTCCIPCLSSHNPQPQNPSLFQRIRHGFMFPPHGHLATYVTFAVVMLQIWIVLYSLTHSEALPGGNFYSLLILFVCCAIGGYMISFVNLPPLLGMLILGLLLRNLPGVKYVGEHIDAKWSGALRKIALTVILTRAGLGLDVVKLKKLSWAVLRLAFVPCASEILTVGIVSHYLLDFPWVWSMMLGCILGALSPAVTVPSLVSLQDRRYGVAKGIPTMLLAAGGLDNVLCVTAFSVFMGVIFSDGDMAVTIIKGPIGVVVGIIYGFVAGIFLWYFPAKDSGNPVFFRSVMLICCGLISVFGSSEIGLSGAGPLGCLTTATVAAYKWRQRRQPGETDEIAGVMALTWLIMQHFLFGLIGTAVNISNIQSNTAGLGIATLAIGLFVRSIFSFNMTMGTGFNLKERVFITLTWLSKATVQAAIGGLALDKVMESTNPDPDQKQYATDILTLSVLAIIICAPTGATLMAVLGPKFLVKGDDDDVEVTVTPVTSDDAHKPDNGTAITVNETVEVVTEKDSLRGSRNSLESEVFKSELNLVLQNRKKSESSITGFDNPAFDVVDSNPAHTDVVDVKPAVESTPANTVDVAASTSDVSIDNTTTVEDTAVVEEPAKSEPVTVTVTEETTQKTQPESSEVKHTDVDTTKVVENVVDDVTNNGASSEDVKNDDTQIDTSQDTDVVVAANTTTDVQTVNDAEAPVVVSAEQTANTNIDLVGKVEHCVEDGKFKTILDVTNVNGNVKVNVE